ncbi:MAG: hypothetical protein EXX96DRAFT_606701 [Benjaminiella poitrasii]|nr:MAG: hypothetical protein EXX96DRAFT_606701 [Benjaminiella poitrasii]
MNTALEVKTIATITDYQYTTFMMEFRTCRKLIIFMDDFLETFAKRKKSWIIITLRSLKADVAKGKIVEEEHFVSLVEAASDLIIAYMKGSFQVPATANYLSEFSKLLMAVTSLKLTLILEEKMQAENR